MNTETSNPQWSPWQRFRNTALVATLWNGLVGTFLYFLITENGPPLAFLLLAPFVLLGLLLAYSTLVSLLALCNPRAELEVNAQWVGSGDDRRIRCERGEQLEIRWEFFGNTYPLHQVELSLVGFDKVEDLTSIMDALHDIRIYTTTNAGEIIQGRTTWEIPAHIRPSIGAQSAQWRLRLRGKIHLWPDAYQEIPVEILDNVPSA